MVGFLVWTALYCVLAVLAHNYGAIANDITVLWPAGGVALYLMLRYGRANLVMGLGPTLVGGLLAAIITSLQKDQPTLGFFLTETLLISAAVAGAVSGAAMSRLFTQNWDGPKDPFSHPRSMVILLAAGCEAFAFMSALVGTTILRGSLALRGIEPLGGANDFIGSFIPWLIGDLASCIMVTPALIAWSQPGRWERPPATVLILWGLTIVTALAALSVNLPAMVENAAMLLLIGPALAAAAFSTRPRMFCAIVLTTASLTLIVVGSHNSDANFELPILLLLAQLYILTVTSTQFVLYATVAESRRSAAERINLARHFSPNMVELVARLGRPFAKPRKLPATVLFCDIRNFTGFSEKAGPEETMELLRDFHKAMAKVIFAHHGTLDRFLGDGLMAVFGMPEPRGDDARRALACGFAMLEALDEINRSRTGRGLPEIAMGIGIHKGDVMLGDIGGEQALAITVVGDTVNAASRLQVLCRTHGAAIVVSREALEAARNCDASTALPALDRLSHIGRTLLRGRSQETEIWGLALTASAPPQQPAGEPQSLARST
ncbi:adenylate/guanylate cyclase domain-containing protein [Chelatococcus asaccharovorans]|uniref:adenylate/guanylate cyclase domain-containing protein n=1 Tax=Chelatococcus asaccharovorans TaxID=28210 RepID=UPI00224C7B1C|nr:adenylate/guanylate cyclase domain-containing protein [Chelatococcus asaccharovorans]CAH1654227.1 Class 3 adenylate cyclase [Chelatococcus asaccharovorans]CAH1685807.1 Class 3 adenylate cyclase [Chelatococcus asaccharovorans]